MAKSAEASKARDSTRGVKTQADYELVHTAPSEEAVVVQAFGELERMREVVSAGASANLPPALQAKL